MIAGTTYLVLIALSWQAFANGRPKRSYYEDEDLSNNFIPEEGQPTESMLATQSSSSFIGLWNNFWNGVGNKFRSVRSNDEYNGRYDRGDGPAWRQVQDRSSLDAESYYRNKYGADSAGFSLTFIFIMIVVACVAIVFAESKYKILDSVLKVLDGGREDTNKSEDADNPTARMDSDPDSSYRKQRKHKSKSKSKHNIAQRPKSIRSRNNQSDDSSDEPNKLSDSSEDPSLESFDDSSLVSIPSKPRKSRSSHSKSIRQSKRKHKKSDD